MVRQYSSTAVETALTAGINASVGTIAVGSVSGFPITFPYTLSIDADTGSKELVEVTAAAGLTLTVTRGIDGTTGVSHTIGAVVRHDHSARDFAEPQAHIANTSNPHAVTKSQVGLSAVDNTADSAKPVSTLQAAAIAAEATLARNADNLTSGTVGDARIPATIARDAEVTSAVSTHSALTTGVHGVTGNVVGTSDTQTLTAKTLTSPTITTPTVNGFALTGTSYTPTWTSASGSPAIGNGVLTGRYWRLADKLVYYEIFLQAGSSTTFGTGQWSFTLPTTNAGSSLTIERFNGTAYDLSATATYPIDGIALAGNTVDVFRQPATAGSNYTASVNGVAPFTWATGDTLNIRGLYPASV